MQSNRTHFETVQPQAPSLQASAQTAREGQQFQLNCSSVGGNPEPNITWYRNNVALPSESFAHSKQDIERHLNPATLKYTTSSILSWQPTVEDHQAVFRCAVWNRAMPAQRIHDRELKLDVECKYCLAGLRVSAVFANCNCAF